MEQYKYKAFGLEISSEIELPELLPIEFCNSSVEIKFGQVPKTLDKSTGKGIFYETGYDEFLFHFDSVGSYHVIKGQSITISPSSDSRHDELRLFLLGSVIGALLHQRGSLPIHGSTIQIGSSALIVCGKSSAGKSSLAAGFFNKGYTIYSDDISVISVDLQNVPMVHQGLPHIKLWQDVLQHFGDFQTYNRTRRQLEKFKKPVSSSHIEPIPVKDIIILGVKNSPGFSIHELKGNEKFKELNAHIYRPQFINEPGMRLSHFQIITQLAKSSRIFKLERPSSPMLIRELVTFVEQVLLNA